jgi:hypothetical protein
MKGNGTNTPANEMQRFKHLDGRVKNWMTECVSASHNLELLFGANRDAKTGLWRVKLPARLLSKLKTATNIAEQVNSASEHITFETLCLML